MLRDPGLIPLSQEHQHALGLCVLTRRSLGIDGSAENIATQARNIVGKFDAEIRDHFDFEERVLFPMVEGHAQLHDLIAELLSEHVRILAAVEQLRYQPSREAVDRFCDLLEPHVHKEEQLLFEETQRILTRPELDSIRARRRLLSCNR